MPQRDGTGLAEGYGDSLIPGAFGTEGYTITKTGYRYVAGYGVNEASGIQTLAASTITVPDWVRSIDVLGIATVAASPGISGAFAGVGNAAVGMSYGAATSTSVFYSQSWGAGDPVLNGSMSAALAQSYVASTTTATRLVVKSRIKLTSAASTTSYDFSGAISVIATFNKSTE